LDDSNDPDMPLMVHAARQGAAHGDESAWTVLRCEEVIGHPCGRLIRPIVFRVLTDLAGEVAEIGSVSLLVILHEAPPLGVTSTHSSAAFRSVAFISGRGRATLIPAEDPTSVPSLFLGSSTRSGSAHSARHRLARIPFASLGPSTQLVA
jgi:hypothetical protein